MCHEGSASLVESTDSDCFYRAKNAKTVISSEFAHRASRYAIPRLRSVTPQSILGFSLLNAFRLIPQGRIVWIAIVRNERFTAVQGRNLQGQIDKIRHLIGD